MEIGWFSRELNPIIKFSFRDIIFNLDLSELYVRFFFTREGIIALLFLDVAGRVVGHIFSNIEAKGRTQKRK